MSIQNPRPEPTNKRTWQPYPPLFARRTQIGRDGVFYTTVTVSVPQKTAIGHITGIRFGLSNGRAGCFTFFHSWEEAKAFSGWLSDTLADPELERALKLSHASQVVTSELPTQ